MGLDSDPMESPPSTFAQRYCQKHGIAETQFCPALILQALHLPSRWFAVLLLRMRPQLYELEFELARYCGQQSNRRSLENELREYQYDSRNRGFWRDVLRQRVSTQRLRRLFRETMNDC